jgi:urease accessory protein
MKNFTPTRCFAVISAACLFPVVAHAHSVHAVVYDCASGIAHPFQGWDHLFAMIAVGFWAMQLGGRARWIVPAAFVGVMTCAAAVGTGRFAWPGIEPMIGTSVLVLGLLIATARRLPLVLPRIFRGDAAPSPRFARTPQWGRRSSSEQSVQLFRRQGEITWLGVALVSLFAAGHGFAHGTEIPLNAGVLPYAAGFVVTTVALHAFGLGLGHLALRGPHFISRVLGAACAVTGVVLVVT